MERILTNRPLLVKRILCFPHFTAFYCILFLSVLGLTFQRESNRILLIVETTILCFKEPIVTI
jgi:hypothetical protein